MNKLRPTQKGLVRDGQDYLLADNGKVGREIHSLIYESAADRVKLEGLMRQLVRDAFDAGMDAVAGEEQVERLEDELRAEENESAQLAVDLEVLEDLFEEALTALEKHDKDLAVKLRRERNS